MVVRAKVAGTLAKVNERTKIAGKPDPKKETDANYFDVYDLEFLEGTTPEEGGQTVTISGNKSAIALQASLIDALRDVIRYELAKIEAAAAGASSDKFKRSGHPEVRLFFFQKSAEAEAGYRPLKGEISFDLMHLVDTTIATKNSQSELIKQSDITQLSANIKQIFTAKYKWIRGEKILVYHDWSRGYRFQIYCQTQTEGERIVKDLLKIQGHTIDKQYLKLNEPLYPDKLPKPAQPILGKERKPKRYRPESTVYYSHATLHLPTFGLKVALG